MSCPRPHCQIQGHEVLLLFPSLSFMILGPLWRCVLYFQLIFVCVRKEGSGFLLCISSQAFSFKRLSFLILVGTAPCRRSFGHVWKVLSEGSLFCSFYVCVSVSMLGPHSIVSCGPVICFEIGICKPPTLSVSRLLGLLGVC